MRRRSIITRPFQDCQSQRSSGNFECRRTARSLGPADQIKAQFGADSNEFQALGYKKKSEFKSPTRTTAPAPQRQSLNGPVNLWEQPSPAALRYGSAAGRIVSDPSCLPPGQRQNSRC
jgi:hypothetical protein